MVQGRGVVVAEAGAAISAAAVVKSGTAGGMGARYPLWIVPVGPVGFGI